MRFDERSRGVRGRLALGLVTAVLTAGLPMWHGPSPPRPSILVVLTDDMATSDLAAMPRTRQLVGEAGADFEQYFVTSPECCPSRVTMLTGQYPHNSGVLSNSGPHGGFETAHRLGLEHDTLATRLQHAGYRTALFGKYLNGYPGSAGSRYIPPGWTTWAVPVRGHPYSQYDYTLNENRRLHSYGNRPADYGTDVFMRKARDFVTRAARANAPFFAVVSVFAPHLPAIPARQDLHGGTAADPHRPPSFDQPDVIGSPSFVRHQPPFTPADLREIDALARRRQQSLQAVDRGLVSLVQALRRAKALRRSYVFFTSDNGFHLGEHRLPAGKLTPYDTDTHVPFLVRGPGIPPGEHVSVLTANIDFAPTVEAIARVARSDIDDGRSLLPLARNSSRASARWPRTGVLIERRRSPSRRQANDRGANASTLEPPDPDQDPRHRRSARGTRDPAQTLFGRSVRVPDFGAVRTTTLLYVEYATGERELYDLVADPDQVRNLMADMTTFDGPVAHHAMARQLAALRACAARACREADGTHPSRRLRRSGHAALP